MVRIINLQECKKIFFLANFKFDKYIILLEFFFGKMKFFENCTPQVGVTIYKNTIQRGGLFPWRGIQN